MSALLFECLHVRAEAGEVLTAREERREGFTNRRLKPWLVLSNVVESDFYRVEQHASDHDMNERFSMSQSVFELVADADLPKSIEGLLVYVFDGPTGDHQVQEASIGHSMEGLGFSLGRRYLPFGKHFNHFISGPVSEFAETRGNSVVIEYSPIETLAFSLFAYRGQSTGGQGVLGDTDWGASLEVRLHEGFHVGTSYVSDLSDSDARLLADSGQDDHGWEQRVDALSGFAIVTLAPWRASVEAIHALRGFAELPREFSRPEVFNSEVAVSVHPAIDVALRAEQSRELAGAPARRYGASITWSPAIEHAFWPGLQTSVALEYLWSRFDPGSAETDSGQALRLDRAVGAQLAISF